MKRLLLFPTSINRILELWNINFVLKGFLYLFLCLLYQGIHAQTRRINGPAGSESFGSGITVLTNGNYVVTDPLHDVPGVANVGAVHLYNGRTHTLISTVTGSQANDQVGSGGVTALTNNNFVISSPLWKRGVYSEAGAATWGSGTSGISGVVSASNSLIGSTPNDNVSSYGIKALPNGNYVVVSPHWEHNTLLMNDAGAVTWGNGNTGTSGVVTESNSIVGSKWDDTVGGNGITILSNSNYVIISTKWGGSGPLVSLGAVTWVNGSGGTVGRVSATNSLVGSYDGDDIGSSGVKALPHGNYVVNSPFSRQGAIPKVGAITWGSGTTGVSGAVSASNSLVGSTAQDQVGNSITGGVILLTNGNYVVRSETWDNGSIVNAGAVTWCNGLTGRTGVVSSGNSLVGSTNEDQLGGGPLEGKVVPLSNGHYVVSGPGWNNGATSNVGAVIWCNGSVGLAGVVTSSLAIIGAQANDQVGQGIIPLTNGNYVISSPSWDNGATSNVGAVTWANGSLSTTGTITSSNSIIGNTTNDFISQKIIDLTSGNYVIASQYWNNGATADVGAATWRNGTAPTSGTISVSNSLIGSSLNDNVGRDIVPLHNGNYVVGSPIWNDVAIGDAGAVTWGNGSTGITGLISVANSLIGRSPDDAIGIQASTGVTSGIHALTNGNYIVESHFWNNIGLDHVGAVTLGNGLKGTTGTVDASNSLVGSTLNDNLGYYFSSPLVDGNYLVRGVSWDNGANANVGSMTLGNGSFAMSGKITPCNSIIGQVVNEGGSLKPVYNEVRRYLIVGALRENSVLIYNPTGQALPTSVAEASVTVIGNNMIPLLTDGGCDIVASITPNGADPVRGKLRAQVWIEGTVPSTDSYPYVARHYQITPEENTSTARVTLYFTYKEFFEFNSHSGSTLNLPLSPADVSEISNLRVQKFAGKSNDDSGLPISYTEGSETINPEDSDIIWNGQQNRWEVSFDVNTGFSGFIVHTNSSALPVRLVEFKAKAQEEDALLQWEIADASNFSRFEVERSTDAKHFHFVSKVAFSSKENKYNYVDLDASRWIKSEDQIYYRLKMLDADESYAYSRIVSLTFNNSSPKFAYPNPFGSELSIHTKGQNNEKATIQFIDQKGMVVLTRSAIVTDNRINLTDLKIPEGSYVISVTTGSETVNVKAIKANEIK